MQRNANRGEFYTPKHISDLLFDITSKYIPGFNKDYVVWDNCWGTGNLTNEKEFEHLFCSTLQQIDIRKNKHKNPNAKKFQYDFLNKDIEQLISPQAMWLGETNLPEEIDYILRDNNGKPLLFYINPPYVATGVYGTTNTDTREDQTASMMKDLMREHKMQSACDQAFAQFLYKINLIKEAYDNKNISIAVICPPIFLTAQTYENFRARFLKNFKFEGGALFAASEFEDLSDRWAISIQIYSPGESEDKKNFKFDVYELKDKTMNKIGEKVMYNLDGERCCMDWAKEELKSDNNITAIHTLSSGCKISDKKQVSWEKDSLGYIYYKGNSVYHNEQELGLLSLPYGDGSGYSITKANFEKTLTVLCARRSFSRYGSTWINNKDEFCIPDTNSEAYKKLQENSIPYMLFNGSSNMSSIFINESDGRTLEVPNNFHHIPLDETMEVFKQYNVKVVGPGKLEDRYLTARLKQALDSGLIVKEGLDIIKEYRRLWEKTIPLRAEFDKRYPEYQVMNWDASFYQLKWVIKDTSMDDFKQFQLMYRQFEEAIRPLVHECGFLR